MKTQNPWMGRAKKSAGGMTATKFGQDNILRSKPLEVTNPKTEAQMTQRNFFALLIAFVSLFSPDFLKSLFPNRPPKRTRRAELAAQLAPLYVVVAGVKTLDLSSIAKLGNGKKGAFIASDVVYDSTSGNLEINWNDAYDKSILGNTAYNPNLFAIIFADDGSFLRTYDTGATPFDNETTVAISDVNLTTAQAQKDITVILTFSWENQLLENFALGKDKLAAL